MAESVALEATLITCAQNGGYPDFQVAEKAGGKIQLIDTPMTMTLQSFCTRAVAIGPNIGPGVVYHVLRELSCH